MNIVFFYGFFQAAQFAVELRRQRSSKFSESSDSFEVGR